MIMAWAICTSEKWCAKCFMAIVLPSLCFRSIVLSFTSEASAPLLPTDFILSPQNTTKVVLGSFLIQWHCLHSMNVGKNLNCSSEINKPSLTLISVCVLYFDISSHFLERRLITRFWSFSVWTCCFCNPHSVSLLF